MKRTMKPKFKPGDSVKIINYGSLMWFHKSTLHVVAVKNLKTYTETENVLWADIQPELINKIGNIEKVTHTQHKIKYALTGIPEKYAWYDEDQLELVSEMKQESALKPEIELILTLINCWWECHKQGFNGDDSTAMFYFSEHLKKVFAAANQDGAKLEFVYDMKYDNWILKSQEEI